VRRNRVPPFLILRPIHHTSSTPTLHFQWVCSYRTSTRSDWNILYSHSGPNEADRDWSHNDVDTYVHVYLQYLQSS
jgi:hypothetical protein